jgi:hypothetical protein
MVSLSFVAGILVAVLVPILVLATGVVNMGADVKPGLLERTLAPWGLTAMPAFGPTHTDEEIWKIVALIRHLPDLTTQEQDSLRTATGEAEHHHHGGETNVMPHPAPPAIEPAPKSN